jgi:hypothetical protein
MRRHHGDSVAQSSTFAAAGTRLKTRRNLRHFLSTFESSDRSTFGVPLVNGCSFHGSLQKICKVPKIPS